MANKEQYTFGVKADTETAEQKLKRLEDSMKRIHQIQNRGSNNNQMISMKDADRAMREMAELTRLSTELQNAMQSNATANGVTQSQVKQFQELRKEMSRVKQEYRQIAHMDMTGSKAFNSRQGNLVNESQRDSLEQMQQEIRNLTNMDNRMRRNSNRASSAGYLSSSQAGMLRSDFDHMRMLTSPHAVRQREQQISNRRREWRGNQDEISQIRERGMNSHSDRERVRNLNAVNEAIQREIKSHEEYVRKIDKVTRNVNQYTQAVEGVQEKPERGTAMGMAYERAPSLGMFAVGAATYAAVSTYNRGAGIAGDMREPVTQLGMRTGTDDFQNLRTSIMELGHDTGLGLDYNTSMALMDNYMGSVGYSGNIEEARQGARSQGEFARYGGVSTDSVQQLIQSAGHAGMIRDSDDIANLAQMFSGSIRESGREGYEQEQLDALNAIVKAIGENRDLTREDLQNVVAMQTVLASSDSKALQGQAGANFMQSVDEGIRGAFGDPTALMMMGLGTTHFGVGDTLSLMGRQLYGASDPENVQAAFNSFAFNRGEATDLYGEVSLMKDSLGKSGIQVDSPEVLEGLIGLFDSGALSFENFQETIDSLKSSGQEAIAENQQSYEGDALQTEANMAARDDQMMVEIYDLAEPIRDLKDTLLGLPAPIYALGIAVGGLAAAVATMAASLGAGQLIRGTVGKVFGGGKRGGGPRGGGAPPTSRMERREQRGGGLKGRLGGLASMMGVGGMFTAVGSETGEEPQTRSERNRGRGGIVGTAANWGGKLLRGTGLLGVGLGAVDMFTAPKEEKGRAVGGFAGGLAGAAGGAALGSVVPGVGTVIGGLAGGIGGYFGGSSIGDWVQGMFSKDADTTSSVGSGLDDHNQQSIESQDKALERDVSGQNNQNERQRSSNITNETSNLRQYRDILNRVERALNQARMQNGIIGNMNSSGGNSTAGGNVLSEGQWTNSDLTRHDLGSTVALTAEEVDAWIDSKVRGRDSVMSGMGSAFVQAAEESGLDVRYLVAHAAHETGWGTSNIAKQKGNMYGIGAYDNSPMASAFKYGDASKGIIEGANWIAKNYYQQGQTTLHDMKFGQKQYATDPAWHTKIADAMAGAPTGRNSAHDVNVTVSGEVTNVSQVRRAADNIARGVTQAFGGRGAVNAFNFLSRETRRV